MSSQPTTSSHGSLNPRKTSRRHFRIGWWSLLLFLTLGIVLEILHGFKVGFYLDVTNSTRRLMWTLAHTHGTLLSILNIVFALSVHQISSWKETTRTLASRCLLGALVFMPIGFFLGGVRIYGGDPGLGIALVLPGAFFLFLAVFLTAKAAGASAD